LRVSKAVISKRVLEKTVKAAVRKRLNELHVYQHWPVQFGLGNACLDCHGCYCGHYFAIECKRPGGKLTRRQQFTILQIQAAGGVALVIDSVEAAKAISHELLRVKTQ
jgi:hypothetical protein